MPGLSGTLRVLVSGPTLWPLLTNAGLSGSLAGLSGSLDTNAGLRPVRPGSQGL